MIDNPIIEEVRQAREDLLEKFNGDLTALMLDAQRRTEEAARAGHPVLKAPLRPPFQRPVPQQRIE